MQIRSSGIICGHLARQPGFGLAFPDATLLDHHRDGWQADARPESAALLLVDQTVVRAAAAGQRAALLAPRRVPLAAMCG